MLFSRTQLFRIICLHVALFSITTSASAFELFLPPGSTLEQVSTNTLAPTRYIGYPQLSGDGRVLYYIDDASTSPEFKHDLIRWQRGVPALVVTGLPTQEHSISISRPTTNFDGSLLSYATSLAPDGTDLTDRRLYLYEHGVGNRELFGAPQYPVFEPMMSPDGHAIYFSSRMSFGSTNPRNEMSGFRYDLSNGQVAQVIQFPAVSQGSYPNHASWRGVAEDGRSLILTNGNFNNSNPDNRVSWRILDGTSNVELQRLIGPFSPDFENPSFNLTSMMSVDGRYALYTDTAQKLWRYDAEGGQSREMPFETRQRTYVMSGNGKYIYYAHDQDPATLHRLEIDTGVTELLLTQAGEVVEWHLATDYSGNRVAFRARENLTGMNPSLSDQVFLLTLVPEPSGWQLLMVIGLCGVVVRCWNRFHAINYRVGSSR